MSIDERHARSTTGEPELLSDAVRLALETARDAQDAPAFARAVDRLEEALLGEARAAADAARDTGTGLPVRAAFAAELTRHLAEARRHDRRGVLVVLHLGARTGVDADEEAAATAMTAAAALVVARIRTEDTIGRVGRDRIGVLLRETTVADAAQLAEDLRGRIAVLLEHDEAPDAPSGAVLGLDRALPDGDAALLAADMALETARAAGGGRIEIGTPAALPRFAAEHARDEELIAVLSDRARAPSIESVLSSARELLGMEIAYLTRHTDTEQIFLRIAGDPTPFGVDAATRLPLEATYCQAILEGTLPSLMPDLTEIPEAMAMPVTESAGVRAYASVPVLLSDGRFYGTLCAADQAPRPQLGSRDLQFLHVLARLVAHEIENDAYLREQHELRVQAAGADALVRAVEARDAYTGAHSRDVVDLAVRVAQRLGLHEAAVQEVAQVALLHDIGKIAVPDAILRKPGPLDDAEREEMRRHPEHGERLISGVPELAHLAPAIRAEHESFDGTGYPDGLHGESIPIASRITLACDAFHAMTSDRPYRPAMSRADAIQELSSCAGAQFCPGCVQALLGVLASREASG